MKPFRTFEAQLNILKNDYNLKILDEEALLVHLETISYNELIKTYKDTLLFNDNKFIEGVTAEGIFQLYHYDKSFQNILMKFSTYVENILKTKLSYVISKKFGIKTDITLNYFSTCKNEKMLKDIDEVLRTSKSEPINHYRETHTEIPPWILYKNLTFSTSITMYKELLENEKEEVVFSYLKKFYREKNILEKGKEDIKEEIEIMLSIVRYFRNTIAHNGHFCKYKSKYKKLKNYKIEILFGKNIINKRDLKNKLGENDTYSFLLSLYFLLSNNELREIFLFEILTFLSGGEASICEVYISILKLPEDIIERLSKLQEETISKR